MALEHIRNFCIISHIDHGKSTLADRFLELTGAVDPRKMKNQLLDSMDLEREKGITIKLTPATMEYKDYKLNLIDTPGHADFTYEVSRSLEAVEGAILLVDATQGIQAQTLNNLELAKRAGLVIIPVVNKIDLPEARTEEVALEIAEVSRCDLDEVRFISAKTGENVEGLLETIIEKIPSPRDGGSETPRALVFDSYYDDFRGVVVFVRVTDGVFRRGE
jgi:GTP-binding protein LepA